MKGKIVRSITAVAAAVAMVLSGAGVAAASQDTTPGKGFGTASTTSIAALIQELQTQLSTAVEKADLSAVTSVVGDVESAVTGILGEQRFAGAEDVMKYAALAADQSSEVQAKLAEYRAADLPDPLSMVNGIVQGLLDTLGSLLDSLLSAAPALPDLPIPGGLPVPGDLPVPGGVPELPGAPELPDAGLPDAGLPAPELPVPLP